MNNMIWRIKLVKPAKKQRSQPTSTSTELPKTVVVSVRTVNESETQNLGKEIENLLASGRTNTATIIKSNSTRIAESNTEQTENEYSPTKKHINTKENNSPLMPMEESVSAVEKKTLSSLPLTTSEVEEDSIEKKSKTETSMSFLKRTDTQKTDIDYSAQTATSQWVCMDIVRTLKVSFEGKEYDFIELSDGSLVWNENLEPYRKQQKLNVAENVLKYGTGGINIDESRVGYTSDKDKKEGQSARPSKTSNANEYALNHGGLEGMDRSDRSDITGRFPANLLHDNSEEVRECFPESTSGARKAGFTNKETGYEASSYEMRVQWDKDVPAESGNASRFFKSIQENCLCDCHTQISRVDGSEYSYCVSCENKHRFKSIIYQAKASKSERNKGCEGLDDKSYAAQALHTPKEGSIAKYGLEEAKRRLEENSVNKNNHPTVKPIALMEYLIKMVTQKGGIVLDPFAGSGSTLVAAKQNGYQYIGIEMTEEYIPISKARLNND